MPLKQRKIRVLRQFKHFVQILFADSWCTSLVAHRTFSARTAHTSNLKFNCADGATTNNDGGTPTAIQMPVREQIFIKIFSSRPFNVRFNFTHSFPSILMRCIPNAMSLKLKHNSVPAAGRWRGMCENNQQTFYTLYFVCSALNRQRKAQRGHPSEQR